MNRSKENLTSIGLNIVEKVPYIAFSTVAGSEIAQNNPTAACLSLALVGAWFAIDSKFERDGRKYIAQRAFELGAISADVPVQFLDFMMINRLNNSVRPLNIPKDGVFYRSMDGAEEIDDFGELLFSLGEGPEDSALRIAIILGHEKKRDLRIDEVETLRRARAILIAAPDIKESLCEEGQDKVTQLLGVTEEYESSYLAKHPTS